MYGGLVVISNFTTVGVIGIEPVRANRCIDDVHKYSLSKL